MCSSVVCSVLFSVFYFFILHCVLCHMLFYAPFCLTFRTTHWIRHLPVIWQTSFFFHPEVTFMVDWAFNIRYLWHLMLYAFSQTTHVISWCFCLHAESRRRVASGGERSCQWPSTAWVTWWLWAVRSWASCWCGSGRVSSRPSSSRATSTRWPASPTPPTARTSLQEGMMGRWAWLLCEVASETEVWVFNPLEQNGLRHLIDIAGGDDGKVGLVFGWSRIRDRYVFFKFV